jgi:hypothetical protein
METLTENQSWMADIAVETSNSVFETLEEWNNQLKSENLKLHHNVTPSTPSNGPKRRGPTP